MESAKGATELYCPLDGAITSINRAVISLPSVISKHPEDEGKHMNITTPVGWLYEIQPDNDEAVQSLMTEDEYRSFIRQGNSHD